MSVYLQLLLAPKRLFYHFNSSSQQRSTFLKCVLTPPLYECISSMTCVVMEQWSNGASITLESEVMIWKLQCAIVVSARLEHFIHCKYYSQFTDHIKLLSRSNCLFSRFNSNLTPFYGNYCFYHKPQLL